MRKFLELDGLIRIKKWLAPLPDGSLPNMKIREQLLAVISDMPIELEHLQKSELGRVVMFLANNNSESRENRRICKNLIEKWSRPIFNLSSRYDELEEAELSAKKARGRRTDEPVTELDRIVTEHIKDTSKHHAHIPKRSAMDFLIRPADTKPENTIVVKNPHLMAASADKLIKQKLTKGGRLQLSSGGGKKVLRAEKISIEGRGR